MKKNKFGCLTIALLLVYSCQNPSIVIDTLVIETSANSSEEIYNKVSRIAFDLQEEWNLELKNKNIYQRLEVSVISVKENYTSSKDGIESISNESNKIIIKMVQKGEKELSDQLIEISNKYVKILKVQLLKENITLKS